MPAACDLNHSIIVQYKTPVAPATWIIETSALPLAAHVKLGLPLIGVVSPRRRGVVVANGSPGLLQQSCGGGRRPGCGGDRLLMTSSVGCSVAETACAWSCAALRQMMDRTGCVSVMLNAYRAVTVASAVLQAPRSGGCQGWKKT